VYRPRPPGRCRGSPTERRTADRAGAGTFGYCALRAGLAGCHAVADSAVARRYADLIAGEATCVQLSHGAVGVHVVLEQAYNGFHVFLLISLFYERRISEALVEVC
jgi:hypothetical protein